MSESRETILIVEDDLGVATLEQRRLQKANYHVLMAGKAEEALALLGQHAVDLMLLDYRLPNEVDGIDFYQTLKDSGQDVPVILVTGFSNESTVIRALCAGVRDFVNKSPAFLDYLPEAVERVMRQVRTERQLLESEKHVREQADLLDQANDAILTVDLDGRIQYWNQGAERLYGWSAAEALGRAATELLHRDGAAQLVETDRNIVEKGQWSGELKHVTRAGRDVVAASRWTLVRDDKGQPRARLVINTDITERKKLEAQYLRAQRVESLGTLAGGIAHDLNNVLTPIVMGVDLLRSRCADAPTQTMLETLQASAKRGAQMVKQILTFSRGVEGSRQIMLLAPLLDEIAPLLEQTFPKNIIIRRQFDKDLWPVVADATQMHQVLMNLCVNARDAMPEGGRLSVAARNITLDEYSANVNPEARAGGYVLIEVEDTGTGMAPHVIERIFDPFFTTKELGKGTGLGLSTVSGIVKNHGGFVRVYSEVGKGSRFAIYLPTVPELAAAASHASAGKQPQGQGELILIVDDEASIREITRATLEAAGFGVVAAQDGAEAISLYMEHRQHIRAALVDLMMPVVDGLTTIRTLRRFDPNLPIVAASGLMERNRSVEIVGGVRAFVTKPFTAYELLQAIHDAACAPRIVEKEETRQASTPSAEHEVRDPQSLIKTAHDGGVVRLVDQRHSRV